MIERLDILLLCNRPTRNSQAPMVFDHLDAFHEYSRHNIFELSTIHSIPSRIDLAKFDVIVIHYTLGIGIEHYINYKTTEKIGKTEALKVVFIQDEYRNIHRKLDCLAEIGADIVFTCIPEDEMRKIYLKEKLPDLTLINNLSGYVNQHKIDFGIPDLRVRPIDVGYRTRKPPYWLGKLGVEKWKIADDFRELAKGYDLRLDFSYDESDRIYGQSWLRFLSSCKAVLGVESGSDVVDFSGDIENNVQEYLQRNPMAEFQVIYEKFLKNKVGKINIKQISPRVFEAAEMRTLMILFEGYYSGIISPWKHYVPLKKDFSNFEEVMAILKDNTKANQIVETAYTDLIASGEYGYDKFIQKFDSALCSEFTNRNYEKVSNPYTQAEYKCALNTSFEYLFRHIISSFLQRLLLGIPNVRKFIFRIWFSLPENWQKVLRPYLRIINK